MTLGKHEFTWEPESTEVCVCISLITVFLFAKNVLTFAFLAELQLSTSSSTSNGQPDRLIKLSNHSSNVCLRITTGALKNGLLYPGIVAALLILCGRNIDD